MAEAFQLGHAVAALHDLALFSSSRRPATAAALARKHRLDGALLAGVLEYVAARTDLLRKRGNRFVTTRCYSAGARFLLDMYAGAYASNAAELPRLLRNPSLASKTVDRRRHARAFEAVDASALGSVPGIVQQLALNGLLDLGCGTAALLIELAMHNPHFVGWGVEINPVMCDAARRRIAAARLEDRVRVLLGDCTKLRAALPSDIVASVRSVIVGDVANGMFADGPARAIAWLRRLRAILPERLLLISDYYGCLGRTQTRISRETLLQDYVQVISGQGVPPASAREWHTIYRRAGCRLIHVIEDHAATRFLHLLQL